MFLPTLYLVCLILVSNIFTKDVPCESNEYCTCSRNIWEYHYTCYDESVLNITFISDLDLFVDCHESNWLNKTFIHKVHVYYNIKFITMKNCPVPSNGFHGLFKNLKDLQYLDFKLQAGTDTITGDDFKGMHQLKTLLLMYNNITDWSQNSLKHMENVNSLTLDFNSLKLYDHMFQYGVRLTVLSLSNNNLTFLPKKVFKGLKNLMELYLINNKIKDIENGVFEGLDNLNSLNLSSNFLSHLNDHVFGNKPSLLWLTLSDNILENISGKIFANNTLNTTSSTNLKHINLKNNHLKHLPTEIFKELKDMQELFLSYNQFEVLDHKLFLPLNNLKYLHLEHNKIRSVSTPILEVASDTFHYLEEVDLSYNKLMKYPRNSLIIGDARRINLEFNLIDSLEVEHFIDLKDRKNINLKDRKKVVNLENNNISVISFKNVKYSEKKNVSKIYIDLSHNPIFCDCQALDLVRYIDNKNFDKSDHLNSLSFECTNLKCIGPAKLRNRLVKDVKQEELTCKLTTECTEQGVCDCFYRPKNETLIVDCAGRKLSKIPELKVPENYTKYGRFDKVELHFESNNLKQISKGLESYSKVTKLFLQNNFITNISWIPNSVQVLDLGNNNLTYLDSKFLKLMRDVNLQELTLANNPWICDCGTLEFSDVLKQLNKHIIDVNNIICNGTGKSLINLNYEDLCPNEIHRLLYLLVICLGFVSFTVFIPLLCYILYGTQILIWLYSRGACLWLIEEERIDKSKIYDAFISFAHQDEEFVTKELVSVLEGRSPSYKLCIHMRDWKPGDFIATQIANSVRDSRRTLVVLSPHFLTSVWGKLEFRAAHTNAMKEGRLRVIIILYGDIDLNSLEEELKAYTRTNTYIKWGDPWFWEKLRYALPRTRRRVKAKNKVERDTNIDQNDS